MKMKLDNLDYWNVAQKSDIEELYPGKNRMIQAMKELHPIIESFISKKVVRWWDKFLNRSLKHTFPKFLKVVEDSLRTPITGFNILYDGHYSIDIYCYPELNQDLTFYYFPMSFLPYLKKTNRKLHDMSLEMFRIIAMNCDVWTMRLDGQDGWFVDCENENLNYDEADLNIDQRTEIEVSLKHYEQHSMNYYNMLDKYGNVPWLQKQIDSYTPMVHAEQVLLNLMDAAITISKQPGTMQYYNDHALEVYARIHDVEQDEDGHYDFPDGGPVSPGMTMRIGWFESESFIETQLQWLGDQAGNFGQADYTHNYQCRTATELKDSRRKFRKDSGRFLEYLAEWFEIAEQEKKAIYDYSKNRLTQTLFTLDEQRQI